jgi:hypothetical protein
MRLVTLPHPPTDSSLNVLEQGIDSRRTSYPDNTPGPCPVLPKTSCRQTS